MPDQTNLVAFLQGWLYLGGVVHQTHPLREHHQSLDPCFGSRIGVPSEVSSPFCSYRQLQLWELDCMLLSLTYAEMVFGRYQTLARNSKSLSLPTSQPSLSQNLKIPTSQVPWLKAVWTSRGIPKQNFLAWLVVLNRCPTRDRMLGWGLQTDPACLLCNSAAESRDHLYFQCAFSYAVWEALASISGCAPIRQWSDCLAGMQSLALPRHIRLLSLLAWQTSIYLVWAERNSRIHRQTYRSTTSLISTAKGLIKNKISSLRDSNPQLSSRMMQHWLRN